MSTSQAKTNPTAPNFIVGDQSRQRSSFTDRVSVSEAPTVKTSAENRPKRTPWQHRLFGQPLKRDRSPSQTLKDPCSSKQRVDSPRGPDTTTAPSPKKENKKSRWRYFSCCSRKKRRVAPASDDNMTHHNRPVKTPTWTHQSADSIQVDPVVEFKQLNDKEKAALDEVNKEDKKTAATVPQQPPLSSSQQNKAVIPPQSLRVQQVFLLGFPNPYQNCYMNSTLQSLITLAELVRDVSCQEEVWSLIPEAELISLFMNIVRCHRSGDGRHKLQVLERFKRVLSVQAPEFADTQQKDSHEFLTTILDQMRSLASPLQEAAAFLGKSYSCPVEKNLMFKMQNTRTCKKCGDQSIREEEFTNLSLDLIPGGSVQQMLQAYQKETELEYHCECGGKTSSLQSTFLTLPKFLILHLKRFHFNRFLQLVKLHNPVNLFRELIVTSSSQAEGCYSLVSMISHLGRGGNGGHYISDSIHPDQDLDASGDSWLNFNDAHVTLTTGAAMCERRQKTAYILFYQSQM